MSVPNSQIERESHNIALARHCLERETSTAGAEQKAWALAGMSASRRLEVPAWFQVNRTGPGVVVNIGHEIGTNGVTAETLLAALEGVRNIELSIDSRGGDADCALKLYRGLKGRVELATITSRCYSAAVTVALAARNIRIEASAKIMLHPAKLFAYKDAPGLIQSAEYLTRLGNETKAIVKERTGQPGAIVDSWFNGHRDTYFNATAAIEAGLAGEIFTAPEPDPFACRQETENDEAQFWHLLKSFESIRVRDRERFFRNVSSQIFYSLREVP